MAPACVILSLGLWSSISPPGLGLGLGRALPLPDQSGSHVIRRGTCLQDESACQNVRELFRISKPSVVDHFSAKRPLLALVPWVPFVPPLGPHGAVRRRCWLSAPWCGSSPLPSARRRPPSARPIASPNANPTARPNACPAATPHVSPNATSNDSPIANPNASPTAGPNASPC